MFHCWMTFWACSKERAKTQRISPDQKKVTNQNLPLNAPAGSISNQTWLANTTIKKKPKKGLGLVSNQGINWSKIHQTSLIDQS